jgi:hypothetical protein
MGRPELHVSTCDRSMSPTAKTYSSVDVSSDGCVGHSLRAAVGVPGIGHGKEPKGRDERLEGLHCR